MEDIFHLGVKALILNKAGKILVLRANLKTFSGPAPEHWDLPGGRLKKGDNIQSALKREVKEEIGVGEIKMLELIDASISKMRITGKNIGLILFTYLCSISNTDKIRLTDDEHTEFKWVTPKQAAKLLKVKFSDSLVEKVGKF